MASRARKTPTPRVWHEETAFTKRIAARIPLDLMERLRAYVDGTMVTVTDVVIKSLDKYLKERGF